MREARGTRRRDMVAAVVIMFALLGACSKEESAPPPVAQQDVNPGDRSLNTTEIDSLLRMKEQLSVTRDQYWDKHGGVLANANFEVWYASGKANVLQAMAVLKHMEGARGNISELFGRAPDERLVVICSANLEAFRSATGRDWWNYSLIKGDTISLQSPIDLYARRLMYVVIPREYDEWAIGKLSNQRVPRWLIEGLASHLSSEATILEELSIEFGEERVLSMRDMERALDAEEDRLTSRRAYYNAYRMAEQLVQTRGRPAVLAFALACAEEKNLDDAARRIFEVDYKTVLEEARAWK